MFENNLLVQVALIEGRSHDNTAWLVKFNKGDPPKSPLLRGTYIPPLLRGARGDQPYPSSIGSHDHSKFTMKTRSQTSLRSLGSKVESLQLFIIIWRVNIN